MEERTGRELHRNTYAHKSLNRQKLKAMAEEAQAFEKELKDGHFHRYFKSHEDLMCDNLPLSKFWTDEEDKYNVSSSYGNSMDAFEFGH